MKNKLKYLLSSSVLLGSLLVGSTAFAAGPGVGGFGHGMRPAVAGTVASAPDVNGTFTVTAKGWQRGGAASTTPTTYTVTTTNATVVTKSGAASTVSAIASGDMVVIQGTVTGTTVAATTIRDGMMGRPGMFGGGKPRTGMAWGTSTGEGAQLPTGNGQPVIGGNVTAINGNSLTVTNKSNVTYTIDVTSATVTKTGVTGATVSSIVVGDSVVVQGTVNGTSVTASSVIDQGTVAAGSVAPPVHRGFFSSIGGFFAHLFGF